ncbi:hypothetical protein CTAYLR_001584 [Chrysophaeum taylorii]|uniref:Cytokinin riboside 5'-monophosphate phosphoribohydrolase n=1 Tax=Chrysophaeum taylorii TaxID=2483200 RepID=A0AAD7UEV4_9STRA|nr:hypothetical protein CTAYLR_001584 [Chrysophaeum taylorii]
MRIAAYASASSATPDTYLASAAALGDAVARRGHVLVNGGGKQGGMGAMNKACREAGGHIVCVIHERFVVDGVDFAEADEMVVATGESLGERKRLLAAQADVIVALPGGVGTLDELLEAAALSQLDFCSAKPVALLNVDGFYDGLLAQLDRAFRDKLLRKSPSSIIYPATSVADLLRWCEDRSQQQAGGAPPPRRRRQSPPAATLLFSAFAVGALCGIALARGRS